MRLRTACAVAALPLGACTVPLRPATPPATNASTTQLAAAIAMDARKIEHEPDVRVRAELASSARRDADACIAQAPQAVACLFGRGIALGLEAKEHPVRAGALLTDMLATLTRAEAIDPLYENAGPARVQALVWVRAPGWPLGPGDSERGRAAAERAAALRPEYPPNWLAAAEAQAKTGAAADARASYARARDLANKLPDTPDRADWLREADQGMRHLP